jgi:hypothetical protein
MKLFCKNNIQNKNKQSDLKELIDLLKKQVITSSAESCLQACVKALKTDKPKIPCCNKLIFGNDINNKHTDDNLNYNEKNPLTLNFFGQETITHLTDEFLKDCAAQPLRGVVSLASKIYFSKEMPNNHTIRVKSLKQKIMQIFHDGTWVNVTQTVASDNILSATLNILQIYSTNDNEIMKEIIQSCNRKTGVSYIKLKTDLKMLMMNEHNLRQGIIKNPLPTATYHQPIHDIHTPSTDTYGFIYLIHVREFLSQNREVYKIGKTKDIHRRVTEYPKGSSLIAAFDVKDYHYSENILLRTFRTHPTIIARTDIGSEYFEGQKHEFRILLGQFMIDHHQLLA